MANPGRSGSEADEQVAMIQSILPDVTRDQIVAALAATANQVDQAIDRLLDPPAPSSSVGPAPIVGTGESGWGEAIEAQERQERLQQQLRDDGGWGSHWSPDSTNDGWSSGPPAQQNTGWAQPVPQAPPPSYAGVATGNVRTQQQGEHREPEMLPGSPQPHYEPTLVGPSPSAPPASPTAQAMDRKRESGSGDLKIADVPSAGPTIDLTGDDVPSGSTAGQPSNAGFSDDDLQRAIAASLAQEPSSSGPATGGGGPVQGPNTFSEEEAINKALQESLAMSESMTLEADKKFEHPPPSERRRKRRTGEDGVTESLPDPVSIRIANAHLAFLPNVLLALYSAKPLRDQILGLDLSPLLGLLPGAPPPEAASGRQPVDKAVVERYTAVAKYWRGEQANIFAEDDTPRTPVEHVLALQRLFALLTHTERAYVDADEISALLGYAEGENISWPATAPARGCAQTWNNLADSFKSTMYQLVHRLSLAGEWPPEEGQRLYREKVERLVHWRGFPISLPLAPDDADHLEHPIQATTADNSIACISLEPVSLGSDSVTGEGGGVNDLYACIDAKTWQPERKTAHLLDGPSEVIAFALDRTETKNLSSTANGTSQSKKVFGVEPILWVDRYMLDRRKTIVGLREEVGKAEEEMDAALRQKEALANSGGKDMVATFKATCAYLETYRHPDRPERTPRLERAAIKYRAALDKLQAELKRLDEAAASARNAAKAIFDTDDMRHVGPYELTSAVVHDGFIGRDHTWTYFRHDDGRWFKLLDTQVYEVPFESVVQDTSGLHMGAGHVLLVYCRPQPEAKPSVSISGSVSLAIAIKEDNDAFKCELRAEQANIPPAAGSTGPKTLAELVANDDTPMRPASPRSDVAEVDVSELEDTQVEVPTTDEALRLRGGAAESSDEQEEDGSEEEELEDEYVELGYLKKLKKALDPLTMTGKVGGSPIWLNPDLPLDKEQVRCSSCGDGMSFLLQMSAPDDSNPDAYLRAIYVFICRKMSCLRLHGRGAVKAFRIQLPEANPYHSKDRAEKPGETNIETAALHSQKIEVSERPFKAWELICEEEPDDEAPEHVIPDTSSLPPSGDEPADREANDSQVPVDPAFLAFQARLARSPSQILRYLRLSDPPIAPLWPSAIGRPDALAIPPCPICKAERTAEFQIMSTILSSLGIDATDADSLDFGTIAVYTCSQSCTILPPTSPGGAAAKAPSGWTSEVCFVQSFSSEGVDLSAKRTTQQS